MTAGSADRFGPYELLRLLGEGGMGSVFEARDSRTGARVALKVLRGDRARAGVAASRFAREARSAARLDHPGICRVLDAGEVGGSPFIAMEFLEGKTLERLIAETQGTLPWRLACSVGRDIARALEHARGRGVFHRDVKPANVLVDAGGRAKVVDFGLALDAEELDRLTKSGVLLGTPAYMAPEVFERKLAPEDVPATDVYGLGITLYEALSGAPPFSGESFYEVVARIRQGSPPPLVLPEGAPRELATLVRSMIAKDAAKRPGIESVAAELEALIGRGGERRRRRHGVQAAAVGMVLVGLGAAWLATGHGPLPDKERGPPPPPAPLSRDVLLARAREKIWSGDVLAAHAIYDRLLAASPSDEDALAERAALASVEENYDLMLEVHGKLDPASRNPVARVVRALGCVPLGIEEPLGPRTPEERAHPLAALLAIFRSEKLSHEEAVAITREALAARPRSGFVALSLVVALEESGNDAEALRVLEEDRVYEGMFVPMREAERATILFRAGRRDEADRANERVTTPPREAGKARNRRAWIAALRGDAAAVVAIHGGRPPTSLGDRITLAHALAILGREGEARSVLDEAVLVGEDSGDEGCAARALGEGPAVQEAFRALHRTRRDTRAVREALGHVHGARGRLAARTGDLATATEELRHLEGDECSVERACLEATLALGRGDPAGAVEAFGRAVRDMPFDCLIDYGLAFERSGKKAEARSVYVQSGTICPMLAPRARELVAALDARGPN